MCPVSVNPLRRVTVLDRVEDWTLDDAAQNQHSTELAALETLGGGLSSLYGSIRSWELRSVPPEVSVPFASGLRVAFGHVGTGECLMHWYSTGFCNYVGLTAQLALELGYLPDKQKRDAYRTAVCGPIKVFRDKIAAHFARWMHDSQNGLSMEFARAPYSRSFPSVGGRLAVGGVSFIEKRGGKEERKDPVAQWRLTAS